MSDAPGTPRPVSREERAGSGGEPPHAPPAGWEDEYATLSLGMTLPLASLLCFVIALAARPLATLLPRGLLGYPWRVLLPALVVPAASLLGLLLGLLGLRSPQGRGLARLGILMNSVGILLGAAFILAFFYILRR